MYFEHVSDHYLILQSKFGQPGDTSLLTSPMFFAEDHYALAFSYHMNQPDDVSAESGLEVKCLNNLGKPLQTIFKVSGDQGPEWQRQKVCLPYGNYAISFIGALGKTFASDIALDSVDIFVDRTCKEITGLPSYGMYHFYRVLG